MDIQFFDPEKAPQPKDKIKIESLSAKPYPDGWRVRVSIEVTPFQERPSVDVTLTTAAGQPVAQLSVIETMHKSMEFTIHIRGLTSPNGEYTLAADLYFGDDHAQVQHHAETKFTIQV